MSHKGSRQNVRNGKEQISHRMSKRMKVDYILKLEQDNKTRLGFYAGVLKMVPNQTHAAVTLIGAVLTLS